MEAAGFSGSRISLPPPPCLLTASGMVIVLVLAFYRATLC